MCLLAAETVPGPPGVESPGMSGVGGLTCPACPNVSSQVVCSQFPVDKQHQHLMMVVTVEFKAELHCLPCVLIPPDIAEAMSDSHLPTHENK